jgi:hypothetical protein
MCHRTHRVRLAPFVAARFPCYPPRGRAHSGGCVMFLPRPSAILAAARRPRLKILHMDGSLHGNPILFCGPHRLPSPERVWT